MHACYARCLNLVDKACAFVTKVIPVQVWNTGFFISDCQLDKSCIILAAVNHFKLEHMASVGGKRARTEADDLIYQKAITSLADVQDRLDKVRSIRPTTFLMHPSMCVCTNCMSTISTIQPHLGSWVRMHQMQYLRLSRNTASLGGLCMRDGARS